jgi:hypothetical protein
MPDFNVGSGNQQINPYFAALLSGLGGFGASQPNNQTQNQDGTSTTNTSSEGNTNFNQSMTNWLRNFLSTVGQTESTGTSTTTPNLSPQAQQLLQQLTQSYSKFARPVDLTGYQAGQIQDINRSSDLQSEAVNNIMAARGLSNSPAAGTALANVQGQRFGDITKLNQSLPMLGNQLNLQNLNAAGGFFSSIPYGTTTGTSGSTSSQQNQSQDQTGGSSTSGTGYTNQQSAHHNESISRNTAKSGSGWGQAAGGVASILASLFSDERLKESIKELPSDESLNKLNELKPSMWKWKANADKDTGIIAQDVEKVLPHLVHTDKKSGFKKVNYAGLMSTVISGMQELNRRTAKGVA